MGDYKQKANVKMVQKFLDEEKWDYFFPTRNKFYTLEGFLQAVGKFPHFCGENYFDGVSDEDTCRREVATLFAHFGQESSQHNGWLADQEDGVALWRQGLFYVNELGCQPGSAGAGTVACDYIYGGWANDAWPAQDGAQYYGKGPF